MGAWGRKKAHRLPLIVSARQLNLPAYRLLTFGNPGVSNPRVVITALERG